MTTSTTGTGSGSISLNPPGGSYPAGTVVTVTANAATGSSFVGWSGDASGSTNPITLTVDGTKSLTASFNRTSASKPLHLALVLASSVPPEPALPDLIVEQISSAGGVLQITLHNHGNGPVTSTFWVDLYVKPAPVPSGVNQTWPLLSAQGATWGVRESLLPLAPGARLTLTVGDAAYRADLSRMPARLGAGTQLFAQVDSANTLSSYGGVLETHEVTDAPYNNIGQTVLTTVASGGSAQASETRSWKGQPPARPIPKSRR